MTAGLLTTGGVDFDSCFQTGSGTQLLYIYASNGADIGQRYLPVSSGSAYGTTGFKNPSGTDVGNLLCKAGTNYHVTMTVGYKAKSGLHKAQYGYSKDNYGSLSRIPYWGSYFLETVYYITSGTTRVYIEAADAGSNPIGTTLVVNGISFTCTSTDSDNIYYLFCVSGDVFGLSSKNGSKLNLTFSPAPTAYG